MAVATGCTMVGGKMVRPGREVPDSAIPVVDDTSSDEGKPKSSKKKSDG